MVPFNELIKYMVPFNELIRFMVPFNELTGYEVAFDWFILFIYLILDLYTALTC